MPFKRIFAILTAFTLLCTAASAQKLPSLGTAKEIVKGSLPDGVAYYLVKNGASKGYADIALVQKGRSDTLDSRESLVNLPHFHNVSPYRFLARKGIGYSRYGFIQRVPAATIFRFNDVPMYDNAASDSTLLIIFDLIDTYSSQQAVIVSGDIDQTKILERMKTLSMMVSKRDKLGMAPEYRWIPKDKPEARAGKSIAPGIGELRVTYSVSRPSAEMMNTLQPFVTEQFARMLQTVLTKRMRHEFYAAGVPLGGFFFRYSDSAASSNDETYTISVRVSEKDLAKATAIVSSALAGLDRFGVTPDEFREAKDKIVSVSRKEAGNVVQSNVSYLSRCEAAFLYGTNLASRSTVNEFFAKRRLPEENERMYLNNFISALLDSDKNLSAAFCLPEGNAPVNELMEIYGSVWRETAGRDTLAISLSLRGDTLRLPVAPKKKIKIKTSITEPLTGGQLWTFANGIRVVYKKTSVKDEFSYALLLKGGTPYVPDIAEGESAFVSDMLGMCKICGMGAGDFRSMLESNGITMTPSVSVSDMRINGTAPKNRLGLLLKSLLAYANCRDLDTGAYDYYKRSEALRLQCERMTQNGLNAVMDSIMAPDYGYPAYKNLEKLTDELPDKVYRYAYDQFAKVNDGLFVFAGDIDAEVLKEELGRYLGGFSTSSRYNVRPQVNYRLNTGWSTYTVDARHTTVGDGEVCVNVAMATEKHFSMGNYMAFNIALVALEKSVISAMSEMGMYVDVKGEVTIFPKERMTVFINCRQCRADGLPASIKPLSSLDAIQALRSAVAKVASSPVTKADLEAYKAALNVRMQSRASDQDNLVDAALVRYSEGKDMLSGYDAAIKAVTAADVQSMLSALDNGSKVEYLIK